MMTVIFFCCLYYLSCLTWPYIIVAYDSNIKEKFSDILYIHEGSKSIDLCFTLICGLYDLNASFVDGFRWWIPSTLSCHTSLGNITGLKLACCCCMYVHPDYVDIFFLMLEQAVSVMMSHLSWRNSIHITQCLEQQWFHVQLFSQNLQKSNVLRIMYI